jgi:microcystin-dependent protein
MSEPYLGEIRMFGGNFAPKNNAYCAGQLMSIAQNSALFSLLGTYYGGDGVNTFGLPDLRGRVPLCMGQGPGLSNYTIGQKSGTESVTLSVSQLPMHNHMVVANKTSATLPTPSGNMLASLVAPISGFWVAPNKAAGTPIQMDPNSLGMTGNSLAHENRMPILAITMIIALTGIFPSRN